MTLNHIHFQVKDLNAAMDWFGTILEVRPGYQDERMASLSFNSMTLIVDSGAVDIPVTLGFESDDCDRDFDAVVKRGAVPIEPPANKPWGVRAAYFKGPGAIKCEIEGPVVNL